MTGGSPDQPRGGDEHPSDDLRIAFGRDFRNARIRAGLTQAQVAQRTGLTQQYVSQIEAGHQNITLATMTALARVTGRDVRVLLPRARHRTRQR